MGKQENNKKKGQVKQNKAKQKNQNIYKIILKKIRAGLADKSKCTM